MWSESNCTLSGTEPVRWWVFDNWTEPCWLDWEVNYDNDCEKGKYTCRDLSKLYSCYDTLKRMSSLNKECSNLLGYNVECDTTLHGGGLQITKENGYLNTHLDYDLHPHISNKRRALNLILFVHHKWKSECGGALTLNDPLGNVIQRFIPLPGRLVLFEVNDLSYHGVEKVTTKAERVSLAVSYLNDATNNNTRKRALFLPNRV